MLALSRIPFHACLIHGTFCQPAPCKSAWFLIQHPQQMAAAMRQLGRVSLVKARPGTAIAALGAIMAMQRSNGVASLALRALPAARTFASQAGEPDCAGCALDGLLGIQLAEIRRLSNRVRPLDSLPCFCVLRGWFAAHGRLYTQARLSRPTCIAPKARVSPLPLVLPPAAWRGRRRQAAPSRLLQCCRHADGRPACHG